MDSFRQLIPLAGLLPGFLLVLFRISGIMLMVPFFGSAVVPGRVKIGLSLLISLALWPALPRPAAMPGHLAGLVVAVGGELLIGLAMGLAVTVIFAGLQLVGSIIGQQVGISLAGVFDPNTQDTTDVLASLYYWVGLMVFLAIGGHRLLIGGLLDSFAAVPLGGFRVEESLIEFVADLLAGSFVMAIKMSAPVVVAMLLISVAMGLVARTVPQLNILTVGFSVRTLLGMLLVAATLMAVMQVFGGTLEQAMRAMNAGLRLKN